MMKIVLIILGVISLISLLFVIISWLFYRKLSCIASFKDTLETIDLPIIQFINGQSTFNFVIDTGASNSILNEEMLADFYYKPLNVEGSVYGIDGNKISTNCVEIELIANEYKMIEVFQVMNVPAFDNISQQHEGMKIAGVLGGAFLKKYGFIIDYKDFNLKK